MERLLGAGVLAMILACTIVGARLLRLAARTRQAPEFLLGAAFLLLGSVGYPVSIVARGGTAPAPELLLAGLALQDLACIAMYASTWKTFRSGARWGGWLCAFATGGFAASLLVAATSGQPDAGAWYYVGLAFRAGAFAWAACESHSAWRKMRRRDALGLGDPLVTNRFALWTLSTAGILAGFAIFLAGRLTTEGVATAGWVLAATSLVSLISAATMWLAFVPPPAYVRWATARLPGSR